MQQNIVVKDVFKTNLCIPLSINRLGTTVVNASCNESNGSIDLSVQNGVPPYQYSWSNGANTPGISGLSTGSYTVEITDAAGSMISKTYLIEKSTDQDIAWASLEGVVITADGYYKKVATMGWGNAGGHSSNVLESGEKGEIEVKIVDVTKNRYVVGFSDSDLGLAPGKIEYGWYVYGTTFRVYENGTQKAYFSGIKNGDFLVIRRLGNKIRYFKNNIELYVSNADMNKQLQISWIFEVRDFIIKDIVKTNLCKPNIYHAISSGNWNDPNVWSLVKGGVPSGRIPGTLDFAFIEGYEVVIDSDVNCAGVELTNDSGPSNLSVENGTLTVLGKVMLKNSGSGPSQSLFKVAGAGKLIVAGN